MGDHAVRAAVGRRGGDDDQLAVGLRQRRGVLVHQQVVELEERPEQLGPLGEGAEHVGHEPDLLGDLGDAGVDVGRVVHVADATASLDSLVDDASERRQPRSGQQRPDVAGERSGRSARPGGEAELVR